MNVPGKDVGHGVVVNQHHFCDSLIIKKGLKKGCEIVSSIYRAFLDNEIGYVYKTIKEEGKVIYGSI